MSYVRNTLHRKVHLVSVLKTLEQELNPQPSDSGECVVPADEAEPRHATATRPATCTEPWVPSWNQTLPQ